MNFEMIKTSILGIHKEIGISSFSNFFEFLSNKLDSILDSNLKPIDVFISSQLVKSQLVGLQELKKSQKYNFNLYQNKISILCNKFEDLQSSLAFLIMDESYDEEVISNFFILRAQTYKIIFVINLSKIGTENLLSKYTFDQNNLNLNYIDGVNEVSKIVEFLDNKYTNQEFEAINNLSLIQTLEPIIVYLGNIIKSESQHLQSRKIILSQDANIARNIDSANNLSNLNSTLRQIIQKDLVELERSFKIKYDDMNRNNVGIFSNTLNNIIDGFRFENIDKKNVAGKTETIETYINENFINDFLNKITQVFKIEAEKDIHFINQLIQSSFVKIDENLKQKKIKSLKIDNINRPELNYTKLISSHVYIQKKYSGEITKEGVMEYFVALRDYTGIIMMVIGIFGPLTLMSADSGAKEGDALYFLNSISLFLKTPRQILQFVTIILVSYMLIFGYFDLKKRIPKKRAEQKEKDFDKAKEALLAEGKRIFNDISRDWNSSLTLFIKDYTQSIQNEIDLNTNNFISENMRIQNNKKNINNFEQTNLDQKFKGLSAAERIYDSMQKKFSDMKSNLTKI